MLDGKVLELPPAETPEAMVKYSKIVPDGTLLLRVTLDPSVAEKSMSDTNLTPSWNKSKYPTGYPPDTAKLDKFPVVLITPLTPTFELEVPPPPVELIV